MRACWHNGALANVYETGPLSLSISLFFAAPAPNTYSLRSLAHIAIISLHLIFICGAWPLHFLLLLRSSFLFSVQTMGAAPAISNVYYIVFGLLRFVSGLMTAQPSHLYMRIYEMEGDKKNGERKRSPLKGVRLPSIFRRLEKDLFEPRLSFGYLKWRCVLKDGRERNLSEGRPLLAPENRRRRTLPFYRLYRATIAGGSPTAERVRAFTSRNAKQQQTLSCSIWLRTNCVTHSVTIKASYHLLK